MSTRGSGIPLGAKKTPVKPKASSAIEDIDSSKSNLGEAHTPLPEDGEDATHELGGKVGEAKDTAQDTVEDTKNEAGETAGDAKDQAGEIAEETTETVQTKAKDAKDEIDDEGIALNDNETENLEAPSEIPEEDQVTNAEEQFEEEPEIHEEPEEIDDKAGDLTKTGEDVVGEGAENVGDVAKTGEEAVGEGGEKVGETAEGALEEGAEKTGDVEATGDGALEEGADKIDETKETGEGALEEGADKIDETKEAGEGVAEEGAEKAGEALDFSILEGLVLNKGGYIVDEKGNPVGKLIEGDAKQLAGKKTDKDGNIWNDSGKIIGKAEPIPKDERQPASSAPFEDFPDAVVDASGKILFEGRKVGILTEGDAKAIAGKKVDPDGDILDKHGNVVGKAIREDEEEPAEPEPEAEPEKIDCSMLKGLKVNKTGNLVGSDGKLVGRVVEGSLKSLIGRTSDEEGNIHNDVGKIIGRAEPIPENEKEEQVDTPFEDFPGSIVDKSGDVLYEGKKIGVVVEGDAKKLAGKTVDPEGDIVDKNGTVLGKAERWEEEEAAPEPEIDNSILAGKRVNKAGNVVDSSGTIYGRIIEGDVAKLAGRMCDKQGFVRNEAGDVIGKAELVPEGDREGMKTGPFADFPGSTVDKDGKVVFESNIIGRLIEGDAKKLFGKAVDEDGDVLDKNGNVVGKAERWEEEEVKKDVHPLAGLKVNKSGDVYSLDGELVGKLTSGDLGQCATKTIDDDGDVVDAKGSSIGHVTPIGDIAPEPEKTDVHPLAGLKVNKKGEVYSLDGDLVGKLTSGDINQCAAKSIDDDGDVVDAKGNSIGHVTPLGDIEEEPEPEPETETEEEKAKRLEQEQDSKLASQMATCIQNSLDQIQPVLKRITELINAAEAKPKDELDEEKLVADVKPLIEEGSRILTEANGTIRGLDPDGRIAAQAKHKTAAREATPEEYRLADLLKELTGNVTQTIDNAKKKIDGMPHAKKELNPLWGLLSEPLFQILAAVGLLLSGVLGLVAQLLNGLGLGGIVRGLLGGLGITRVLDGLGLGKILSPITGSKKK